MGVTGRRRLVAQPGGLTFGFGQTLSILGLIFLISLSIFTGNFDIMWLWLTEKCEAFDGLGVDIVAFLTALFLGEYPQRSLSRVAN